MYRSDSCERQLAATHRFQVVQEWAFDCNITHKLTGDDHRDNAHGIKLLHRRPVQRLVRPVLHCLSPKPTNGLSPCGAAPIDPTVADLACWCCSHPSATMESQANRAPPRLRVGHGVGHGCLGCSEVPNVRHDEIGHPLILAEDPEGAGRGRLHLDWSCGELRNLTAEVGVRD